MLPYRGFIVWGAGIVVVLGLFLLFMALGWPGGSPDSCIKNLNNAADNQCYCEAFNIAQVVKHAPGVRQEVNTWFNLYAIFTSLLVAIFVYIDRSDFGEGGSANLIRSNSFEPDLYIFTVQFLGLGSMWFHAALRTPWSWFDGFSMYTFTVFLIAYTVARLWTSEVGTVVIWVLYVLFVALFSVLGAARVFGDNTSLFLILITVGMYLLFEVIATVRAGWPSAAAIWLWVGGVSFIGVATLFWALSQTNGPLCFPNSFFQPHGLIWHPFAGGTAVCLYFYWRNLKEPPYEPTEI